MSCVALNWILKCSNSSLGFEKNCILIVHRVSNTQTKPMIISIVLAQSIKWKLSIPTQRYSLKRNIFRTLLNLVKHLSLYLDCKTDFERVCFYWLWQLFFRMNITIRSCAISVRPKEWQHPDETRWHYRYCLPSTIPLAFRIRSQ